MSQPTSTTSEKSTASQQLEDGSATTKPVDQNDTTTSKSAAKPKSTTKRVLSILLEQWFLLALGILIAIASQIQVPVPQQKLKQTVTSYLCISIIFFVTGSILDTQTLLRNYGRWKLHLFVQLQCFIMTSLIVFGIVSATARSRFMDPGLLVGLIFFSCVATTISSNVVMTRQAHGNTALTVVQTTIGNLIGVFVTPALVVGYTSVDVWYNQVLPESSGQFGEIYQRVLKQLGLSIYLPLFLGQCFRNAFPKMAKRLFVDWQLSKIGSICLLVLLWATYDQAFASGAFSAVPASNMVFIVFISIALWLVFFGIAFGLSILWLPREDVVAICYCVPAKGIVMGVPLTATIWDHLGLDLESKILIPIIIFQGLQLAFASILVPIFRRWVDAQKKQDDEASQGLAGRHRDDKDDGTR